MQTALYAASALILLVSVAHSWLGEKYILVRLFRRPDLPHLFGGPEFTIRTLRFAWHLTSIAWLGLAGVLVVLAGGAGQERRALLVIGAVFFVHFAAALIGSRGRHLSWIAFLAVGVLCVYAGAGN